MKRKALAVLLAVSLISLTACTNSKTEATSAETAKTEAAAENKEESTEKTYESQDGWKISYNEDLFELNEETPGEVTFVYKNANAGSDLITISYHKDKMPSEVLYEKTEGIDDKLIVRSEGYFGNTYPDWSFTRTVKSDEGSKINETFTGIEHNDGTIIIDVLTHPEKEEDKNQSLSDDISAVLDSFTFTNHQPQKEFAYVPGTYTREFKEEIEGQEQTFSDTIVLNADHSGTITFQDTINIIWSSYELIETGSDNRYEYTIEGDMLLLKQGEEWIEFQKKK